MKKRSMALVAALAISSMFFTGCVTKDITKVNTENNEVATPSVVENTDNLISVESFSTTKPDLSSIPTTCKSYFDGCNNCMRDEANPDADACTTKACEVYETPKCLDDEIQAAPVVEGEKTPEAEAPVLNENEAMPDTKMFIGKTIEEVKSEVAEVRVVAEDGNNFAVTMDFKPERLNVVIEKGVITEAYFG